MSDGPTGTWITDPTAYKEKLQTLLGDRDRLAVLSETADILTAIVADQQPRVMQTRPFDGKWTPNEIIGHLVDAEWVFGYRMRLILCEETPTILGMDQDLWASTQRHNQRDPAELTATFRAIRDINLTLWRGMTPDDLARVGKHNERGEESLATMLTMAAGHDLTHIDQIGRYLEAIKTA